ncbi:MAG: beta-lactamase family protein [Chitinophagaceae bacterium]|nr:beta-lactamase family protein [Chitinophagaceae bacterium]
MKKTLLLLLFPLYLFAQPGSESITSKISRVENTLSPPVIYGDTIPHANIYDRMKATGTKAVSIAVIRNYKIEWAKAYGWADEAEQRKATTETRFQAASISKSLNSLGVLKLAQQGKLDPEADINTYLKSWKFPYDSLAHGKTISVNNLLSHTAGLGVHGFPGYKRGKQLPTALQVVKGESPVNTARVRSLFEPGKKMQYSGGGTTITQLVVTEITGRAYHEYMLDEVLKPLGMTNSSYQQPPADTTKLATGYYRNGKPVTGKFHVYPEQAAAGLWTTPTDLAKYIIECQLAYEGKSAKVLNQSWTRKRLTPYIDSNVALGVFIENRGGIRYFNHNGGNEAFLCTSYGSLKDGYGVVIMINGDDFSVIGELLNSVAQVYDWKDFYKPPFKKIVTPAKDSLARYVGDYLVMKDTISLQFCGDDICLRQNGQPSGGYKAIFSSNINFEIGEVPGAFFRVLFNAEGKAEALELKQGGNTLKLERITK